ncbi:hypothetical protein F4821DRAFT_264010 [Hypoxylon rubiginosum]|uniref:Uncharacterized protein n=1 Tax=Hypoxylon rubiginosum TaxID=110542 RepID=A0ACC0CPR9_9PEZI|nr:hypothetical protein F4821DRAFT_264010 [Hypoxylon rubiginosum]
MSDIISVLAHARSLHHIETLELDMRCETEDEEIARQLNIFTKSMPFKSLRLTQQAAAALDRCLRSPVLRRRAKFYRRAAPRNLSASYASETPRGGDYTRRRL